MTFVEDVVHFTVGNAIAQSAQPIISYNYGASLWKRVEDTRRISISTAVLSFYHASWVIPGIWLAMPVSELLTTGLIGLYSVWNKKAKHGKMVS